MRSFVTDDEVTVWHDRAPHNLTDVFGMSYNQFTRPKNVPVVFSGALEGTPDTEALSLIELLKADEGTEVLASYGHYAWKDYAAITRHAFGKGTAEWIGTLLLSLIELLKADEGTEVLASYGHYAWKDYAAITRHAFGKGTAEWIGTLLAPDAIRAVMREAVAAAGIEYAGMPLAGAITVRQGFNEAGETGLQRGRRERDLPTQLFGRTGHVRQPGLRRGRRGPGHNRFRRHRRSDRRVRRRPEGRRQGRDRRRPDHRPVERGRRRRLIWTVPGL